MSDDQEQMPALREQIRLAGHKTRLVGWVIACSCFLGSLLMAAVTIAIGAAGLEVLAALSAWICMCTTAVGLGLILTGTVRSDYARRRSREFGDILTGLPPERQAAVLLPLRDDRSADVREIVRPLVAELKVASEITPAAALEGRGDEPAAD